MVFVPCPYPNDIWMYRNPQFHHRWTLTLSSHWWAFTATWVPSGLVSTRTSPGTALSGLEWKEQESQTVCMWFKVVSHPGSVQSHFYLDTVAEMQHRQPLDFYDITGYWKSHFKFSYKNQYYEWGIGSWTKAWCCCTVSWMVCMLPFPIQHGSMHPA